ncbi:MAG: histidinol-phosphate transaminase [Candidatus Binatus sp.]|uniref:histidinol-phosphate transaminase n=1 Tax=Candidatus Binatus sp. TaxID=2811406 RepID=UPI002721AD63|nr:histidinol-phosphate transaminase [Candidatus Binatus sp.]MDO8433092.1 histidinol-phosphate transaminase [Candidatus Binatus sp.]
MPSVAALAPYEPGKPIEQLQRELGIGEPVKLASNENPIGPSPLAIEAIKAALPELNRYPDGASYALVARIAERHGVAPERVFPASGSVEVINLLAYLFLRPGLNSVYSEHSFAIYPLATAAAGGDHKVTKTIDGFAHDLDAMASAIDANTRLVFLGNPNNPTGTIYRRAEWQRFLKRVPEHVVIVADEAYFEFVRDPEYPDSLQDHDDQRLLITLRTFSKIFGLAGIRVGYAVARPDIIQMLHKVRQPFNVTSLAQVAAIAGMDDSAHIARTLEVNAAGMHYLEAEFRRLGLSFVPSFANFMLVEVGDGRAVYDALLRKGVIVRPMNGYGYPHHVRISVGLPEENRRLIAALSEVIRK